MKPSPPCRARAGRAAAILLSIGISSITFAAPPDPPSAPPQRDDAKAPSEKAGPPSSSETISESQLAGLPLNGRSYSQLATLQSGVSDTSAGSASRGTGGGQLNISGGRTFTNNFLMDRTNIQDTDNQAPRSAAGVQLGSDAVMQVQVLSGNYAAEYGRSSGGVLNSITRSGTPQFHGTLFEFFRNSKLDTRNFFDNGSSPPPFKRNQFGFTLTGPLRKDRTYFMGSFESMRDRLNQTDVAFFPDAGIRLGNVDSRIRPYLNLYPIPNGPNLGRGIAQNFAPIFLPTNETFFTVRIDHKISDRDSVFGRYTFDDASSHTTQDSYLFHGVKDTRQQYLTLVGTHFFNARALNSARLGYTRPADGIQTVSTLQVPQALFFVPGAPQFGQIQIPGISTLGPDAAQPRFNIMNSFQFADDIVLQRGPHAIKLGAEVHRYRWDVYGDWYRGATWSFNSLDSFLQAGPVGTSLSVSTPDSVNRHGLRQTYASFYAQDEYRLRPRFLISAGLRYEFETRLRDALHRAVFMPDIVRGTAIQTGDYYFKDNPSLKDLAPRLGLTWTPEKHPNTVVSSGFGIYYDGLFGYTATQRKSSAPFYKIAINPNFDSSHAGAFPNALAAVGASPLLAQLTDYLHQSTAMILRYNFSIQQNLPGRWHAGAAYLGARANHLTRRIEANQFPAAMIAADGSPFFPRGAGPVNPAFGSIAYVNDDGQSFYNSLQLSASRDLSRGLSLQASYSYSKSIDESSVGVSNTAGQYGLMRRLDRGLSDFDLRHRMVANFFYTVPAISAGRWISPAFRDWRIGGILSLRSGIPFTPSVNVRYNGYLWVANRPNLAPGAKSNPVSGVSAGCGTVAPGQKLGGPGVYFDPCAFQAPPPGTLGNLGRNTVVAPNVTNMDVSLQRDFLIDSKRRVQFRAEFFNLPNHTAFSSITGGALSVFSGENANRPSSAGRISRTANTSRQIQVALRFSF